jgi:uncharacterized protein YraI
MKHLRILAFAATAMLASSTWASAQEAFTTGDVNMRAGPGSRYPVVTTIPENREVYIHGCLSNWDWCDVSWRRNRGWVFSDYLEAVYRNRRIGFDEYRTFVDIPFVSFGFTYWDRYYRDRPWFDDWDHWGDRRDRRHWRDRDHDRDWNRNGDGDGDRGDWNRDGDRDWNRTDKRDEDETTVRRDRRFDKERRPGERRGQRCAPDDPNCGGDNSQPDQMGQP